MIRSRLTFLLIASLPGLASGAMFSQPDDQASQRARLERQLERVERQRAWLTQRLEAIERGETGFDRGPDDRPPLERGPLSPEERDRLIEMLRSLDRDDLPAPVRYMLRQEGAERDRILRRLAPRLRRLAQEREGDPELFELRRRELLAGMGVAIAAHALRDAFAAEPRDEERIENARRQLREAIETGFDVRVDVGQHELAKARQHITSLSEEVERTESQREEIVEKHFREMVSKIERGEVPGPDRDRRPGPPRDRLGDD